MSLSIPQLFYLPSVADLNAFVKLSWFLKTQSQGEQDAQLASWLLLWIHSVFLLHSPLYEIGINNNSMVGRPHSQSYIHVAYLEQCLLIITVNGNNLCPVLLYILLICGYFFFTTFFSVLVLKFSVYNRKNTLTQGTTLCPDSKLILKFLLLHISILTIIKNKSAA